MECKQENCCKDVRVLPPICCECCPCLNKSICGGIPCECDIRKTANVSAVNVVLEKVEGIRCEVAARIGHLEEVIEHYSAVTNGDANPFLTATISEDAAKTLAAELEGWRDQIEKVISGLRQS